MTVAMQKFYKYVLTPLICVESVLLDFSFLNLTRFQNLHLYRYSVSLRFIKCFVMKIEMVIFTSLFKVQITIGIIFETENIYHFKYCKVKYCKIIEKQKQSTSKQNNQINKTNSIVFPKMTRYLVDSTLNIYI